MAGRVVHFNIPIDNPDRAIAFYAGVFGWDIDQWGPIDYWTITGGSGDGIEGGLAGRSADEPTVTIYVNVDDVQAALSAVEANGGQRAGEPMPVPGVGWMARFLDTEGNRIGLFQSDPSAPTPSAPTPEGPS